MFVILCHFGGGKPVNKLQRIAFIRHAEADGAERLTQAGIEEAEKLWKEIGPTEADYTPKAPRTTFFCSTIQRGVLTACLFHFYDKDPIVVLSGLCEMKDDVTEKAILLCEQILSTIAHFEGERAVVICHGYYATVLAELASESVTGNSIRDTLQPRQPRNASGFVVDMTTGEVTSVGQ